MKNITYIKKYFENPFPSADEMEKLSSRLNDIIQFSTVDRESYQALQEYLHTLDSAHIPHLCEILRTRLRSSQPKLIRMLCESGHADYLRSTYSATSQNTRYSTSSTLEICRFFSNTRNTEQLEAFVDEFPKLFKPQLLAALPVYAMKVILPKALQDDIITAALNRNLGLPHDKYAQQIFKKCMSSKSLRTLLPWKVLLEKLCRNSETQLMCLRLTVKNSGIPQKEALSHCAALLKKCSSSAHINMDMAEVPDSEFEREFQKLHTASYLVVRSSSVLKHTSDALRNKQYINRSLFLEVLGKCSEQDKQQCREDLLTLLSVDSHLPSLQQAQQLQPLSQDEAKKLLRQRQILNTDTSKFPKDFFSNALQLCAAGDDIDAVPVQILKGPREHQQTHALLLSCDILPRDLFAGVIEMLGKVDQAHELLRSEEHVLFWFDKGLNAEKYAEKAEGSLSENMQRLVEISQTQLERSDVRKAFLNPTVTKMFEAGLCVSAELIQNALQKPNQVTTTKRL